MRLVHIAAETTKNTGGGVSDDKALPVVLIPASQYRGLAQTVESLRLPPLIIFLTR